MAAVSMLEIAELFVGVADPISSDLKVRTRVSIVGNMVRPEKEMKSRIDITMKIVASGGIRQISAFTKKSTIKVQSFALNRRILHYVPSLSHLQGYLVQVWTVTMPLKDSKIARVATNNRISCRISPLHKMKEYNLSTSRDYTASFGYLHRSNFLFV